MNRFEWMNATNVKEAISAVNSTIADVTVSEAQRQEDSTGSIFKAGGIDLLDLLKENVVTPSRMVNISQLSDLDRIVKDENGVTIGPLVTIAQIAADTELQRTHSALTQAASHIATPQIRNVATVGGNLLQRPKCWYFRNAAFNCVKKGGNGCPAFDGDHEFHAIFDNQTCPMVHASTMATPLVAMNAEVVLTNDSDERTVRLEEFFISPEQDVRRENSLQAGELITAIRIPSLAEGTRSAHLKQGEKESYDWALADVAVVLEQERGQINRASIVLGAAAPIPWRATRAETELIGKPATEEVAKAAARLAIQGATPLAQNEYKLPLFEAVVRRTILQAALDTTE